MIKYFYSQIRLYHCVDDHQAHSYITKLKNKKNPVLVELLYKSMPSSNLHFSLYQYLVHSRITVNSSCIPTHKSKTTMISQVCKSNSIGKCSLWTHHPPSHGVLVAVGSFSGKFTAIVTLSKSISSGDQYVTLQKYFSHLSIVLFTFLEPHPYYWNSDSKQVGRLLIANHLDQSLWWVNQKHWEAVRSYFLHTFLQVHIVAAPFTAIANCAIMLRQNYFPEPNRPYVHFSSSNSTVLDHILSTAGDALRTITCMQTANPATVNI
jgi:hypothetical protein